MTDPERYEIKVVNEGTKFKTRYLVLDNHRRGKMVFGPFDRRESAEAMKAYAEKNPPPPVPR